MSGRKTYYKYDELGNLYGEKVSEIGVGNSGNNFLYSSYNSLDENGNVTENTVSSNYRSIATSYTYNDDGMLSEVEIYSSRRKSYTYSDEGVLTGTSMSTATPVAEAFTYNDEGYIASHNINGTVYSYSYDDNGNITEIKKNGVVQQSYEYDELNQLIRENNLDTGKTIKYIYDGSGNIESKTEYAFTTDSLENKVSTDTVSYAYDDIWKDKLTSYDGKSITYDAIGNPTNYMGAEMTWFARQMMTYKTDDLDISYKYDNNGLRTEKIVNGVKHSYYYVDGLLRTEQIGDSYVLSYRYDTDGKLVAVSSYNISTEAVNILYAQTNTRGDVIALYNGDGDVKTVYTYDSWGKLISVTDGEGNSLGANKLGNLNSIRYRGYVYDSETGLYYLQSRYYDPETGRFLNADAVDFIGYSDSVISYNMFAYCENEPVGCSDPSGLLSIRSAAILATAAYSEFLCIRLYAWGFTHRQKNQYYDFSKKWNKLIVERMKKSTAIKEMYNYMIDECERRSFMYYVYCKTINFYNYKKNVSDIDLLLSIGDGGEIAVIVQRAGEHRYKVTCKLENEYFDFHYWSKEDAHSNNAIVRWINNIGFTTQDKKLFVPFKFRFSVVFYINR